MIDAMQQAPQRTEQPARAQTGGDSTAPAASNVSEDAQAGAASRALAQLNAQADAVRAELEKMRHELAQVQHELSNLRSMEVLEVNTELVQAAVHADSVAQTAVSSLDELARSTQHDELTGAPTRTLMLDRLETAIAMAQRRSSRVGVIFVDLDGFKRINDTLGHAIGDQVLQLATRRLESAVRESDSVSRHGGDEFVVLLAEMVRASDAAAVAQKIIETLGAPALIGSHRLRLSASLGISVYPEDGDDPTTLIDCADAAMYRAKNAGPGGYAFCSEIAEGTHRERRSLPDAAATAGHAGRRPDSALAEHEARLRKLLEANKQLVNAAQTAQKLQANAEEAHQRQINFVAMAAHALRNPLSAIRMAAGTLRHPRIDDVQRAAQHDVIQRQSAHMARLLDDLLDGSRVGTGEFRLQCSELDLGGILSEAIDACRHAIDKKQQRLRTELATAPAAVHGDPQRLTQVFGNLLNNASRRSRHGADILLAMTVGADQVVVTVADRGVGIAPEALPHIFDLFAIDTNVPVDESGLGIGLAVVQELVRAHGGTVAASSAGKDLGSEFIVRLPLAGGAASPRS
ncbi:MAG TPA: diguanylate cyclase [Caldimonas sp.]|jgi:diguanylate cyclase (GGDEF)-like protein|nr:diguanylate cyclase [Caldimonas sp.]HEX4234827.1 diguanylate cyclase [Caldimonas sp.]